MCKFFNKCFQKFYKSLISTVLLNVSPNRNFGDATAVQNLSRIHVRNFVCCPTPRTKILAPPLILILILRFLTMKLLTFFHSCSSIKFYSVIFCIFYGILYFTKGKKYKVPSPPHEAKSWSRYWYFHKWNKN